VSGLVQDVEDEDKRNSK